ncbi:MAG: hypothetical protein RL701_7941 [Pseudomonadota bacterium]|jgi:uncharacterized membrane protein SpoIIM required for sporulation
MHGFDVNRFVQERGPDWKRLERALAQVDQYGVSGLSLTEARNFARLYRRVSSDLVRAQSVLANTTILDYLNDTVARAYAVVYTPAPPRARGVRAFFLVDFPQRFRREWRLVVTCALVLLAGAATGAISVARDPYALGALIPEDHQAYTPSERVRRDETAGAGAVGDRAAAFSSWLFTHNMQVSFLVFGLGVTFGIGTLALLFFNGVPIGALAMQYHQDHQDLFFWAWILPHGVTELTVVCIAGAAGLIIARGLWVPGRLTRHRAVAREAKHATALLLGALPLLGVAGAVEGSLSQLPGPAVPYSIKLLFALSLATGLFSYLLRAGRNADREL